MDVIAGHATMQRPHPTARNILTRSWPTLQCNSHEKYVADRILLRFGEVLVQVPADD